MNDETDYFDMFGLSRQATRQVNYDTLQELVYKENRRNGRKAETRQSLLKQAVSSFKNETEYQNYLKKLNARNSSTDSKRQAEEEDRQKEAREAEARRKAKAELEKERQRTAREAEARRKAEAEAEEAKRQTADAEQRAREAQQQAAPPPKTGWQLFGDVAKHMIDRTLEQRSVQNPPANSSSYSDQLAPANLSGVWQDSQGIVYNVVQTGKQIKVQGSFLYQTVGQGIGTVNDRTVQMRYSDIQGGITDSSLALSTDGQQLEGSGVNYTTGQTYFFQLRRR